MDKGRTIWERLWQRWDTRLCLVAIAAHCLAADINHDTIWATHQEIASLFGVDRSGVTRHINKILASGEVDEKSNVQKMHITNADRPVAYYSLDRILAIGYRVNSAEAIDFRKWATAILKQYLIKGCNVCARGEDAGDC